MWECDPPLSLRGKDECGRVFGGGTKGNMRKKGIFAAFASGLTVGLFLVSALAFLPFSSDFNKKLREEFTQPLERAVEAIAKFYVEDVDNTELLEGAYQGVLSVLDPHSAYFPPEMYAEFKADTKGEFGGLGIQITFMPIRKVIRVEAPIPGTPAFEAGILGGDLIVKIREVDSGEVIETSEFETVHDAVKVLRGEPGTQIAITVIHADTGQGDEVTLTREIIKVPAVRAVHMLDEKYGIGYVYLARFHEEALDHLSKALAELRAKGMRALILDLRFNPGGLLVSAVEVADKFLSSGVIVSTRGKNQAEQILRASPGDDCDRVPLVILVNGYSASASEIVAGAIKDNARGAVVGQTTFGKGSVQTVIELAGGAAMKLTTARYYTPQGISIEEVGITPDVEVVLDQKAVRQLAGQLGKLTAFPERSPDEDGDAKKSADEDKQENEEEEPFIDVQLERALDVLRGALLDREMSGRLPVAAGA